MTGKLLSLGKQKKQNSISFLTWVQTLSMGGTEVTLINMNQKWPYTFF